MIEHVKHVIEEARQNSGRIWLLGYVNSKGETSNYLLQLHGADFYPRLLKETRDWLEALSKMSPEDLHAALDIGHAIPHEVVAQAVQARLSAMTTKLASAPEPVPVVDANMFPGTSPDTVVLKNIEILERSDAGITGGAKTKERTAAEVVDRQLQKLAPTARYSAQFNLAPGKVGNVKAG